MRVLVGDTWAEGHLDAWLGPGQVRIEVSACAPVWRLSDVYFQPPRSLRRLWNYVWEVGPTRLARKVASRLRESGRNEKVVAAGLGRVLACGDDAPGAPAAGSDVLFLAPTHPPCLERVVLDAALVRAAPPDLAKALSRDGAVLHAWAGSDPAFAALGGLLPWAEAPPPRDALLDDLFARAERALRGVAAATWRALPRGDEPPAERGGAEPPLPPGHQRAVLFGYGHYAKTNVLPNLPPEVRCVAVHEVDPTQLGPAAALPFASDSSPGLRDDERYDVCFLAGYHHTHAPLAVEALRRGAYAVSEKPLVTTRAQLDALMEACRAHPGRYFAGFHKRYSKLNDYAWEDLHARDGEPIHYYCIVFEVPLPKRHWYHWPSARSRITSNGCHWIDHFLHMNRHPEVVAAGSHAFPDGDVTCWAQAANGANFSMTLTDKGSNRIGLEEYVEMRTADRKVSVKNNARYRAEDHRRVLRRARVNKNLGYTLMYRSIAGRIARREEGDSLASIERPSALMLALEDGLMRAGPGSGPGTT